VGKIPVPLPEEEFGARPDEVGRGGRSKTKLEQCAVRSEPRLRRLPLVVADAR